MPKKKQGKKRKKAAKKAVSKKKQKKQTQKQRKKETAITEVHEEVKEAVQETVSAWRRVLRPRVLLTTAAFFLLILIAYFLLKINATISEDLVIVLTPHGATLKLSHGQEATVDFELGTNNYFFCEAQCNYELKDISNNDLLEQREGILLQNNKINFSHNFFSPEKGEGQLVYAITVECENIEKRLCARDGETHYTSALITLEYELTEEETAARTAVELTLPVALAKTKLLDKEVQDIEKVGETIKLQEENSLEGLWTNISTLIEQRNTLVSDMLKQQTLWEQERYTNITVPEIEETLQYATLLMGSLVEYAAVQHELVNAFTLDKNNTELFARILSADGQKELESYLGAILRLKRNVAATPSTDVRARSEDLKQLLQGVHDLEVLAHNELKQRITFGKALSTPTNLTNTTENTSTETENLSNLSFNQLHTYYQELCDEIAERENLNGNATLNGSTEFLTDCNTTQTEIEIFEELEDLILSKVTLPILDSVSDVETTLTEHKPECCLFGKCKPCCETCDQATPVIFLHGHSNNERNAPEYSLEAFKLYQKKLEQEQLYVDAGILTPFDSIQDNTETWKHLPISVSATYYYDTYLDGESYILSPEKSESIDTYAIRLKELITTLKAKTGSDKVSIVAHSMGGLVTRRYLRIFGEDDIEQLIMIGTPNHGVEASIASLCPLFGANKECEEMRAGSAFLAKLNDPNYQPGIPVTMIIGNGCIMNEEQGDGVVTVASARIPWTENIVETGTCSGLEVLHTELLKPSKYLDVYTIVKDLLLR